MKTIKVLGTTYSLHLKASFKKDFELDGQYGYCNFIEKKIVVGDLSTSESWKDEPYESRSAHERITLRHEIIHAFLEESGLSTSSCKSDCWARNEEMVDWIAIQYPKIKKVFHALGCEE